MAKNGEGEILEWLGTQQGAMLDLLEDLAVLMKKHDLVKKDAVFSLVCPEEKLKVTESRMQETFKHGIEQVLRPLTQRQREMIKLRYGIGDAHTHTLEEVGLMFNITRERVRQVEAKAIRKLQHPVRARKLEGFLPGGVPR